MRTLLEELNTHRLAKGSKVVEFRSGLVGDTVQVITGKKHKYFERYGYRHRKKRAVWRVVGDTQNMSTAEARTLWEKLKTEGFKVLSTLR